MVAVGKILASVISGTLYLNIPAVELQPLMKKDNTIPARSVTFWNGIRWTCLDLNKIQHRFDKSQESCKRDKKYFQDAQNGRGFRIFRHYPPLSARVKNVRLSLKPRTRHFVFNRRNGFQIFKNRFSFIVG